MTALACIAFDVAGAIVLAAAVWLAFRSNRG
jgi:hypothetical protein